MFLFVGLFVSDMDIVKNQIPAQKHIDSQGYCISSGSLGINKKETLSNYLQMMDILEIKPVSVQDAGKAAASIQYVALIQTLKRKIKSSTEHLTK